MAKKKDDKSPKKQGEQFIKTRNGYKVEVVDSLPNGWKEDKGATTAPKGYVWVTNGKSRFGGQRKSALMKISELPKPAASSKTPPSATQPKNEAPKPAGKSSEPKPAAPKKTPKTAAPKLTSTNKSRKDKLLIHSDKDEMNVGGEKPIILNAKNASPKRVPKVLRKVAKTGGYTAWDEIKRNGKTFATEKEAKDYAADLLKKTGKVVLVSPTDRQVTHTFKSEEKTKRK